MKILVALALAFFGSTLVFTGDELIRWSGNEGEELPAVPDGWALVIGR